MLMLGAEVQYQPQTKVHTERVGPLTAIRIFACVREKGK